MSRILVLDDNFEIITMLRLVLEQRGFEVISGRSGEDGLRLLDKARPQLIISNLRLAGMDGLAFLQQVRLNVNWSETPFVMMNANTREERQRAIDYGADAFLPRPFRYDDLNKTLNNLGIVAARA